MLQLQGFLLLFQLLVFFRLDDDKTVELENDNESVLGREENVHVSDELVVKDKQKTKDQKRGILEDNVD